MDFWSSVAGMVEVELTSAEPETAFEAISARNIEVRDIQKLSELTYSFFIRRSRCKTVKEICRKRGDTLKIRRIMGLYWNWRKVFFRPILVIGGTIMLFSALWIPSKVFFVCVEGNTRVPDRKILAAAEECGIVCGASRREVRSERVKNALLSEVPELEWAGVNTLGCIATISVREKNVSEEREEATNVASILAARDGYVLSCTATAGNLLVKTGDSVRKGQVLISAYTDCGLCIRAERAEGEVMAQTSRKIEAVMPSTAVRKGDQETVKRKYSLLFRKKRIFLWKDSGIWEGSCGRMYKEYYITLPGGFQLPLAFCVESYMICPTSPMDIPQEEADTALKSFSQTYLNRHMIAGKILSGVQLLEAEDGRYRLKGEYTCVEMIGTVRQEQIGDTNGENS